MANLQASPLEVGKDIIEILSESPEVFLAC
jgi:hypothetical protein